MKRKREYGPEPLVYTKFPGFKVCMDLLRKKGNGMMQEEGYHWLFTRVNEIFDDLIVEFDKPENARIQDWIIELIGLSSLPKAFEFLRDQLFENDPRNKSWVIYGLVNFRPFELRQLLEDLDIIEEYTPDVDSDVKAAWDEIRKRVREKVKY
ncbi:MAG: hypothetical protein ABI690_02260 [Chloroflexota bacterium]